MKILICFLFFLPSIVCGSNEQAKKDLNTFLKQYNTGSSANAPKVYKGQMGGYVSAGSLATRNRVFNRKPLTLTPPSYSAGCGGIDLHMGSFSHISKEELVDSLKDIASNAASYAFLLTMKSVSPQAEDCMRWLQEQANQVNALNINSCELAEQAVASVWPSTVGASQHICRSMTDKNGLFRDIASARHNCANDEQIDLNKEDSGDALIGPYNLAWDVIQKDPFLSTQPQFAELFMSITGTVVIDDSGTPNHYPSKVNDADFMKNLFEGGSLECYQCTVSSGNNIDNIFKNSKGCIGIYEGKKDFSGAKSFHEEVKEKLENIQNSLTENTELADADKEILLKTRLPVGRIICALTAYHRGRSPVELSTLSEIVTMDIVCQYLKDVIRNARLTATQVRDVQFYGSEIDKFLENLKDVEAIVSEYQTNSKNIFEEQFQYMKMLEIIENNLKKNISI